MRHVRRHLNPNRKVASGDSVQGSRDSALSYRQLRVHAQQAEANLGQPIDHHRQGGVPKNLSIRKRVCIRVIKG